MQINKKLTQTRKDMNSQKEIPVIFYIDDTSSFSELIKEYIQDSPIFFNLHTFDCPIKATSRAKILKPDLIISDYLMPKFNGFELASDLPEFDFVILSASESEVIKEKLLTLKNVKKVIWKPGMDELMLFLNQTFQKQPQ